MQPNILDRAIAAVAPAWASRRQLARARMDQLKATNEIGYDAATGIPGGSGGNPELDPWRAWAVDLAYEKFFYDFISERYLHYDFKDLTSYIARYNWYAIRELSDYIAFEQGASFDANTDPKLMQHRKKKFTVYYRAPMFFRAWLWFVYNYIFRLGFLDGREGYLYHYFESYWYRFLVDAKIYEYRKTGKADGELRALGK